MVCSVHAAIDSVARERMRRLSQDSEQETLSTYVDGAHSNECEDVDASLVLAYVEVLDTDIESCADVPSAKINGVDACDYHVAKVGCCQSCRTSGVRRELSAAAGELRRGRALQLKTTECDDWDPTGFHATCAEGFDGVVTIGPCSSAGLPYRLSGCVASVEVTSGQCSITDGGLCVASPNYPDTYRGSQGCTITNVPPGVRLSFAPGFTTSNAVYGCPNDHIYINGNKYCGEYNNLATDAEYCAGDTCPVSFTGRVVAEDGTIEYRANGGPNRFKARARSPDLSLIHI